MVDADAHRGGLAADSGSGQERYRIGLGAECRLHDGGCTQRLQYQARCGRKWTRRPGETDSKAGNVVAVPHGTAARYWRCLF